MPLAGSSLGLGLGALGSVLGGVGQASVQADVLGQHQHALELTQRAQDLANLQHQRAMDLTQRAQDLANQQRMTDVPTLFKALGIQVPEGVGQMPTADAHQLAQIAETRRLQEQEQQSGQQAGQILRDVAGQDPRLQALSNALGLRLGASDRGMIQDYLKPQPPVMQAPGATMRSAQGELLARPEPPQTPAGPPPFGYIHEPKLDANGRPSYGAPRPMNAMEHFVSSQDALLPPEIRARHLQASNYGKLVPVSEGGMAVGGGNIAGGIAPGSPQLPGAAASGRGPTVTPGMVMGPTKAPAPEQQDKLANYDTALTNLRILQSMARDPEVQQMLGSLGTNPKGALMRGAEQGFNVPLLGQFNMSTLTPKQREFIGLMASTRTAALRSQEGLRPNAQFQALLAPALSSLSDPGIADKLSSLEKFMSTNRDSLRYELGAANRLAPPAPASAVTPPSVAPNGNRIRVRSKADPSRMGWINAGEPIPHDVEVVR